jgi:hypothetical protein
VFRFSPAEGAFRLDSSDTDSGALGVELQPLFGASIPVIVRQGDLSAAVEITEADVQLAAEEDAGHSLLLGFQRSGNRSVYGDIEVLLSSENAAPIRVGYVRGMAIYTDIESRILNMKFQLPPDAKSRNGTLSVRFFQDDSTPTVWATRAITLP